MHDPLFVAFELRRPWPSRYRMPKTSGQPRWKWDRRHRSFWSRSCFMTLAGRDFYFPSLLTVWHREPGDRDSGEDCGYPHGLQLLRHLDHLQLQIHPWQRFRRWAFTRCAWCGGPSRKADTINLRPAGQGERGLVHHDCSSVWDAYRTCVCPDPSWSSRVLSGFPWSYCGQCGLSRFHEDDPEREHIYRRTRELVGRGERPSPEARRQIEAMWRLRRAAKAPA